MSLSDSPVIIDLKFNACDVTKGLNGAFPGRAVIDLADPRHDGRDLSGIRYAVVWKPHDDLFARAPDLEAVFSGGAGVDHVLSLPGLPDVPLIRFVDRSLTTRMSEWVVMQCLIHLRQHLAYQTQARHRIWEEHAQPEASQITVGLMGLGVLGQDAAMKLRMMGFSVIGWSRTKKTLEGIDTYDAAGLDAFLARTDMLVSLLPLTPDTRGIFDAGLFAKLHREGPLKGPVFINAGRGGSQVQADIVDALRSGMLRAASLDVFEHEPLSVESPLWDMENVIVTPHAAAASDIGALFAHVRTQIDRHEAGLPFEHVVDRETGY